MLGSDFQARDNACAIFEGGLDILEKLFHTVSGTVLNSFGTVLEQFLGRYQWATFPPPPSLGTDSKQAIRLQYPLW